MRGPHGICKTLKDRVNGELLAFIAGQQPGTIWVAWSGRGPRRVMVRPGG
jgi:hypothetical protein